jgi:hypothetical protein
MNPTTPSVQVATRTTSAAVPASPTPNPARENAGNSTCSATENASSRKSSTNATENVSNWTRPARISARWRNVPRSAVRSAFLKRTTGCTSATESALMRTSRATASVTEIRRDLKNAETSALPQRMTSLRQRVSNSPNFRLHN